MGLLKALHYGSARHYIGLLKVLYRSARHYIGLLKVLYRSARHYKGLHCPSQGVLSGGHYSPVCWECIDY
jgi:hypothetical protein